MSDPNHDPWFLNGGFSMNPQLGKVMLSLLFALVAGATWNCSIDAKKNRPSPETTACLSFGSL